MVVDGERPIELKADFDTGPGVAAASGSRTEMQQPVVEEDRVIVGDGALVLEATNRLQLCKRRRGPPGWPGVRGAARKARVVAWEERGEDALRVLERTGALQPEFADETILEGAEEPFDAPFMRYEIVWCFSPSAIPNLAAVVW